MSVDFSPSATLFLLDERIIHYCTTIYRLFGGGIGDRGKQDARIRQSSVQELWHNNGWLKGISNHLMMLYSQ